MLLPLVFSSVLPIITFGHYEEEMLVDGMVGYVEYQSRVKYKLMTGVY